MLILCDQKLFTIPTLQSLRKLTSYLLLKYPIHVREGTETHVSKHHYKGSDHSFTDLSHGENI